MGPLLSLPAGTCMSTPLQYLPRHSGPALSPHAPQATRDCNSSLQRGSPPLVPVIAVEASLHNPKLLLVPESMLCFRNKRT